MGASFAFSESNGAEVVTDSISNLNLASTDAPNSTPASYPVVAGQNSYEKYFRGKFGSTFTEISNIKFWKSLGDYKTDEIIKAIANQAYGIPVMTASTKAISVVPITEGTALAIQSAAGTTTITTPGYTKYLVLQAQTLGTSPAGAVNQKTFIMQYDEM